MIVSEKAEIKIEGYILIKKLVLFIYRNSMLFQIIRPSLLVSIGGCKQPSHIQ